MTKFTLWRVRFAACAVLAQLVACSQGVGPVLEESNTAKTISDLKQSNAIGVLPASILGDEAEPLPPEAKDRNDVPRRPTCVESPGKKAISVRWAAEYEGRIDHLAAILTNNTSRVVRVRPVVSGLNPYSTRVQRHLAWVKLAPDEERVIEIAVDSLPLQSVGTATGIEVGAIWERPELPDMTDPASATETIFVTHLQSETRTAIARGEAEELRLQQTAEIAKRPTELRRLDAATGRVVTALDYKVESASDVGVIMAPVEEVRGD